MTPRSRTSGSVPSTDSCPDDAERARPFDSGTQYAAWVTRNCQACPKCAKYDEEQFMGRCDIDGALVVAHIGDGTVSPEIADRMGYTAAHADGEFPWTWACPEREEVSR